MGLRNWIDAFRAGRLGFRMDEVMTGWHEFEPGRGPAGQLPFEFQVTWGADDLRAWTDPHSPSFLRGRIEGTVTAGGLCEAAPCKGTLELRYFSDHRLRYDFTFDAGGKAWHYVAEKVNIQPWNLPVSHTTAFGVLTEAKTGKLVSRSVTHFRVCRSPAFLASFRLVARDAA